MTAVDLMSLRLVFKMKPRFARVCLDSSSTFLTVKAYGDVCLFDAEARIWTYFWTVICKTCETYWMVLNRSLSITMMAIASAFDENFF